MWPEHSGSGLCNVWYIFFTQPLGRNFEKALWFFSRVFVIIVLLIEFISFNRYIQYNKILSSVIHRYQIVHNISKFRRSLRYLTKDLKSCIFKLHVQSVKNNNNNNNNTPTNPNTNYHREIKLVLINVDYFLLPLNWMP